VISPSKWVHNLRFVTCGSVKNQRLNRFWKPLGMANHTHTWRDNNMSPFESSQSNLTDKQNKRIYSTKIQLKHWSQTGLIYLLFLPVDGSDHKKVQSRKQRFSISPSPDANQVNTQTPTTNPLTLAVLRLHVFSKQTDFQRGGGPPPPRLPGT